MQIMGHYKGASLTAHDSGEFCLPGLSCSTRSRCLIWSDASWMPATKQLRERTGQKVTSTDSVAGEVFEQEVLFDVLQASDRVINLGGAKGTSCIFIEKIVGQYKYTASEMLAERESTEAKLVEAERGRK